MVVDLRVRVSPLVVASDASESGMGVCRTSSLEADGRRALAAYEAGAPPPADGFGLIEVFAGIGGLRRAVEIVGVRPAFCVAVDIDPGARDVIIAAWPDAHLLADIRALTPEPLRGNRTVRCPHCSGRQQC